MLLAVVLLADELRLDVERCDVVVMLAVVVMVPLPLSIDSLNDEAYKFSLILN
jgi:hypothetical protein